MSRLGEFQPPDVEEDTDALWDAWFDQQKKNGMAVIDRDEWNAKLDEAASIGYAEGREDERELFSELVVALTEKRRANQNITANPDAAFKATDRVWAAYDAIVSAA